MSEKPGNPAPPDGNRPKEVTVTIDDQGNVSVDKETVRVERPRQLIRWQLNPASARHWRLEGIEWCGDAPPVGEFHDWRKEQGRVSVIDRNTTRGEWRYGILYRAKGPPGDAELRRFDPMIRNEPQ